MLDHEAARVPPVVEDLAAQNMSSDAPDALVALLREPLVAQVLRVDVVHLEAAVVHVRAGRAVDEEGVVVDVGGAAVDVGEERDVAGGGGGV